LSKRHSSSFILIIIFLKVWFLVRWNNLKFFRC
jgi:hypothetical protein